MFFHQSRDSRFFFSVTTLHFSLLNLPVFFFNVWIIHLWLLHKAKTDIVVNFPSSCDSTVTVMLQICVMFCLLSVVFSQSMYASPKRGRNITIHSSQLVCSLPGPAGPAGNPGAPGSPGAMGPMGHPGGDGPDGKDGEKGQKGVGGSYWLTLS